MAPSRHFAPLMARTNIFGMATAERWIESRTECVVEAFVHRGDVELIERWGDEWRSLCADAVDDQPFYRPEWIAAHIRTFTPNAKVLLVTVVADGRLSLILPLLEERAWFCGIPVRKLRAPVNGHSCRFDAVCRRGTEGQQSIEEAWKCLKKLPGWDLIEFEGAPAEGSVSALANVAESNGFLTGQIAMSPNPFVPIPANPATLRELPLNKRLRTHLRSIRREVANRGALKLRRITTADQPALQRFYELESAGWKGVERTAIASSIRSLHFYEEIARSADKLGHLCLYELKLDDQLLASHLGLVYKGRYFSPKVAHNEDFRHWAPGHLLVEEILRDCAERGIREYDITGQNDLWKRKWTDQTRGQCVQYIFGKGFRGRLAQWLRFSVRPAVKRMVP
jgi:CelD/BcsL family acetyltransferase involved in cellulose biosynthesis